MELRELNGKIPKLTDPDLTKLRARSSWFQWYSVCTKWATVIQALPYYLSFNHRTGRYVVITSKKRKAIWLFFQAIGAAIFWQEVAESVTSIRKSHDSLSYFDLLEIAGYICFDYPFKYVWLFQTQRIQEFFDQLQDSPVLKISSKVSTPRTVLYAIFNGWYLFTLFLFFLIRWGVYHWTFQAHYETIQTTAEFYFGIPKAWSVYCWYPVAMLVAFAFSSQQSGTYPSGDMLSITSILTMKQISDDLDKAIKSNTLPDNDVLQLIEEQKRLTYKFNRAFGLLVAAFVVYGSPYYSLHFVDMFEIKGLMNQLSMFTYVVMLGLCCKWAIDILVKAQRRKRWLVKHHRLMGMDRHTLAVFLDDLTWEKFGLGRYYVVNKYVSGQIVGLLLTVAIVRIQITHERAIKGIAGS